MTSSRPRVVLVAHTTAAIPRNGFPWALWESDASSDADLLAEFAGRLCYQSWDRPNPATRSNRDYIANILRQQHHSILEHASATLAFIGVSRSFTHELVRHRHLSYSQLSQRYVAATNAAGFVVPPLLRDSQEAMRILEDHHRTSLEAYRQLLDIACQAIGTGKRASRTLQRKAAREAARCVLPNMTATTILATGNHRAWREVIEKRCTAHADAEMREVMLQAYRILRSLAPATYQDLEEEPVPGPAGQITVVRRRESR